MAWGILETGAMRMPPGTVALNDSTSNVEHGTESTLHLKRSGGVILQPQPSDSPNDPLNWSFKVKGSIFFTLMITMTALRGVSGMLSTAERLLSEKFYIPYPVWTQTLGPPEIASTGVALFVCSPLAAVYGKRVQFFLAIFTV
jgi:hypothetical protein